MKRRHFLKSVGLVGALSAVSVSALSSLAEPNGKLIDLSFLTSKYLHFCKFDNIKPFTHIGFEKVMVPLEECKMKMVWGTFEKKDRLQDYKVVRLIDFSTNNLNKILETQTISTPNAIRMVIESILEDRAKDSSEGSNIIEFIICDGMLHHNRLVDFSSKDLERNFNFEFYFHKKYYYLKHNPKTCRAIRYILEDRGVNTGKGVQEWEWT